MTFYFSPWKISDYKLGNAVRKKKFDPSEIDFTGSTLTLPSFNNLSSSTQVRIEQAIGGSNPIIEYANSSKLSNQSDNIYLEVNTVDDPGIKDIDFADNIMSLREAIFISQHPDISSEAQVEDTVYINFSNEVQGQLNQENMPDHMFYLESPLPQISRNTIKINTINPQSVIISPAFDEGGKPKDLNGSIMMIGGTGTSAPHLKPDIELNRINIIRNTVDSRNVFYKEKLDDRIDRAIEIADHFGISNGGYYDFYPWSSGITLMAGDLTITNSVFQNNQILKSGQAAAIAVLSPTQKEKDQSPKLTDNDTSSLTLSNVRFEGNEGKLGGWNVQSVNKGSNLYVHNIDQSPVKIHNVEVDGTILSSGKISNSKSVYADLQEYMPSTNQVESDEFVYEAKSYLYQKQIANIIGNTPIELSPDRNEIITLSYDRPTSGDVAIFTDFSKLLNEVKSLNTNLFEVQKEVIESRKGGTEPDVYDAKIEDLEAEKEKSWLKFGLDLTTSLIGLNIDGVVEGDDGLKKKVYANTRYGIYSGTKKAAFKFGASTGTAKSAATGLTTALPIAGLLAGTTMKIIDFVNKQEKFDEEKAELKELREEAKANLIELESKTKSYQNKMREFENNQFEPGIGLSFSSLKQQRKPIVVNNFELGKDIILIPNYGEDMDVRFNHIRETSSINGKIKTRKGFEVEVYDGGRDQHSFTIAKVYVDQTGHHENLDYGNIADSITLRQKDYPKAPWILMQGRTSEITQVRKNEEYDEPIHTTVRVDRSKSKIKLKTPIETATGIGHDSVIGTDGWEQISTYGGDDIIQPKLGKDTIDGSLGYDVVIYDDLRIPIEVIGTTKEKISSYEVKNLRASDAVTSEIDSTLENIEIISVPSASIINLTQLPEPDNDEGYIQIVRDGVDLKASTFNDEIVYKMPDLSDFNAEVSKLKTTTISGSTGNDSLAIERETLPADSILSIQRDLLTPNAGKIKISSSDSSFVDHILIEYSSIESLPNFNMESMSDLQPGISATNVSSSSQVIDSNDLSLTNQSAYDLDGFDDDFTQSAESIGGAVRQGNPYLKINIKGSDGNDYLNGGFDRDLIRGKGGADNIIGFKGVDTLKGGSGQDTILGSEGSDLLYGGANSDTLLGGPGSDILKGGTGLDTYIFAEKSGHDTISDFKPKEKIIIYADNAGKLKRKLEVISNKNYTSLFFSDHLSIRLDGFNQKDNLSLEENILNILQFSSGEAVPY